MNILDGEEDILDTTLEGFSHISDIESKAVSKLVNPLSTLFSSSKEEGGNMSRSPNLSDIQSTRRGVKQSIIKGLNRYIRKEDSMLDTSSC